LLLNVQVADDIYQLIKKEYEEARIREGKQINEIRVVSPAVPPFFPSKPTRAYYWFGAFGIALLIGIGLAFIVENLNTTIRSIENVDRALHLPVLATLPVNRTRFPWTLV